VFEYEFAGDEKFIISGKPYLGCANDKIVEKNNRVNIDIFFIFAIQKNLITIIKQIIVSAK
jgi:hypothetical protein